MSYSKKEYRTLRVFARTTAALGWLIVIGLFLVGVTGGWSAFDKLWVGVLMGLAFGLGLGIPVVVSGQVISVFLDQKELLEEILTAVRKSQPSDLHT